MVKGITPISKVKAPRIITLEFMLDRTDQRKIAAGCGRCGGTGSFSNVSFEGIGSRHGAHCFACGDAWKLPVKWSYMEPKNIAALFGDTPELSYVESVVDDFVQVGILSKEKADKVIALIGNSQ